MHRSISVCFLLPWLCAASAAFAQGANEELDISAITAVEVTGDAGKLSFTTDSKSPYHATMVDRPMGWLASWRSSWFSSGCGLAGRMRVEGTTLRIEMPSTSWLDDSDCMSEVSANLPENMNLAIKQKAVMASLSGNYASIRMAAKAGDFALDGHADKIDLTGDAMRARLDFQSVNHAETISIDSQAADIYVTFGRDVPISYIVNANASLVDAPASKPPGGKPSVMIKGGFIRATIK